MENLIEALTAKNSEYIHAVTKNLLQLGKSDEEVKAILSEILPKIVEGQKSGQLAKKMFGTPSEFVEQYEEKKADKTAQAGEKNEHPALMWLDSALLFFGFISIVNAVMLIASPKTARSYGILTTVLTSAAAGLVMYLIYRFYYKKLGTERQGWNWKHLVITVVAVLVWGGITALASMIPSTINLALNGYVSIIIGLIAIGVRWLLKRQFNIQSAMVSQRAVRK